MSLYVGPIKSIVERAYCVHLLRISGRLKRCPVACACTERLSGSKKANILESGDGAPGPLDKLLYHRLPFGKPWTVPSVTARVRDVLSLLLKKDREYDFLQHHPPRYGSDSANGRVVKQTA